MAQGIKLDFNIDSRKAISGMAALEKQSIKLFQTLLKGAEAGELGKSVKAIAKLESALKRTTAQGKNVKQTAGSIREVAKELKMGWGERGKAAASLLTKTLRGYNRTIKQSEIATKRAAEAQKQATKIKEMAAQSSKRLAAANRALSVGWRVVTAGVSSFTKFLTFVPRAINLVRSRILSWTASIFAVYFAFQRLISGLEEYYKEMRNIRMITGAAESEMRKMGEMIEEVALTYPVSTGEVAKAAHVIADYGLSIKDVGPYLEETIRLSSYFGESAEAVADVLYAATQMFDKAGEGVKKTAAIIFAASTSGILNLKKYTDAFIYTGDAARVLGFGLADLSLLITLTSERILRGSKVGTGLRRMLVELARIAGTTGKKTMTLEAALESLGITQEKVKAVFADTADKYGRTKALVKLLSDAMEHAGGRTEALAALAKVLGVRAMSAGAGLSAMKERMQETIIEMERKIPLYEELAELTDDLAWSTGMLKNTFDFIRLAFLRGIAKPFGDLVVLTKGKLLPELKKLADVFGKKLGVAIVDLSKWLDEVEWPEVTDWMIEKWDILWAALKGIAGTLKDIANIQFDALIKVIDTLGLNIEKIAGTLTKVQLAKEVASPFWDIAKAIGQMVLGMLLFKKLGGLKAVGGLIPKGFIPGGGATAPLVAGAAAARAASLARNAQRLRAAGVFQMGVTSPGMGGGMAEAPWPLGYLENKKYREDVEEMLRVRTFRAYGIPAEGAYVAKVTGAPWREGPPEITIEEVKIFIQDVDKAAQAIADSLAEDVRKAIGKELPEGLKEDIAGILNWQKLRRTGEK